MTSSTSVLPNPVIGALKGAAWSTCTVPPGCRKVRPDASTRPVDEVHRRRAVEQEGARAAGALVQRERAGGHGDRADVLHGAVQREGGSGCRTGRRPELQGCAAGDRHAPGDRRRRPGRALPPRTWHPRQQGCAAALSSSIVAGSPSDETGIRRSPRRCW